MRWVLLLSAESVEDLGEQGGPALPDRAAYASSGLRTTEAAGYRCWLRQLGR